MKLIPHRAREEYTIIHFFVQRTCGFADSTGILTRSAQVILMTVLGGDPLCPSTSAPHPRPHKFTVHCPPFTDHIHLQILVKGQGVVYNAEAVNKRNRGVAQSG